MRLRNQILSAAMLLPGLAALHASEPRDAIALAAAIDRAIDQGLAANKSRGAPQADDAEFCRRVYLDITGVIPSADQAAAFLDSKDPHKRRKLIDELLASPSYGRHMGDIWQNLLLAQRDIFSRQLPSEPLANWFADGFNRGKPWDKQVTELLTSSGTQEQNGATTFFLGLRYPDKLTDTVCRTLLGIQLQCAQCHDHPFTTWKRTEYWGMAAFFAKVEDGAPAKLLKGTPNVREASAVQTKRLPDSALQAVPRFLGGDTPKLDSKEPYRPVLARWLTSEKNPYFARAMVNRVWAQHFGRGLVNPVDDLSDQNAPSHPELFEALSQEFVRSGFDVKHVSRAICNSQAYQRSSTPLAASSTAGKDEPYASMKIKPMTPEQLFDSLATVLGPSERTKKGKGKGKGKGAPAGSRAAFVDFFRPNEAGDPNEFPAGIPQVLQLMNAEWTAKAPTFVRNTIKADQPIERNLERLFLATLSRRPTASENERLGRYLQTHRDDPMSAYGDVVWALLNSSEFTLNH